MILGLYCCALIYEYKQDFVQMQYSYKLIKWFTLNFISEEQSIEFFQHLESQQQRILEQYSQYITECQEIERILKNVVSIPKSIQSQKIPIQSSFDLNDEKLYNRFKVQELNSQIYIHLSSARSSVQQFFPPALVIPISPTTSQLVSPQNTKRLMNKISNNKDSTYLGEDTTIMASQITNQISLMENQTKGNIPSQELFSQEQIYQKQSYLSQTRLTDVKSRLSIQRQGQLINKTKKKSSIIQAHYDQYPEQLQKSNDEIWNSDISEKKNVYQQLIKFKKTKNYQMDLDRFISKQVVESLNQKGSFIPLDQMKKKMKFQREINIISNEDYLDAKKILFFEAKYQDDIGGNRIVNNKIRNLRKVQIHAEQYMGVIDAQNKVKDQKKIVLDLHAQETMESKMKDSLIKNKNVPRGSLKTELKRQNTQNITPSPTSSPMMINANGELKLLVDLRLKNESAIRAMIEQCDENRNFKRVAKELSSDGLQIVSERIRGTNYQLAFTSAISMSQNELASIGKIRLPSDTSSPRDIRKNKRTYTRQSFNTQIIFPLRTNEAASVSGQD